MPSKEIEEIEFLSTIELNPDSCYKVVHNGKIIGSALGTFNGRRGWIYHLAIHPDFQAKKLGSRLLEKTVIALENRGARRIILSVVCSNLETVSFYKKNHFEVMNDAVLLKRDMK